MLGGAGTSLPETETAGAFGSLGGGPACQCAWLGS